MKPATAVLDELNSREHTLKLLRYAVTPDATEFRRSLKASDQTRPRRRPVLRALRCRRRRGRESRLAKPKDSANLRVVRSERGRLVASTERLTKATLVAVVLSAGPIYPAGLSYSYVEGSYAQLETDGVHVGGAMASGTSRGATIRGAARLTDHLFIYGGFTNGDLSDVDELDELALARHLGAEDIDASVTTSAHSIGVGLQIHPVRDLSLYARAGYVSRKVVVSFEVLDGRSWAENSADGAQAAIGVRASLGRMELFAEGKRTDVSDQQQGDGGALEVGAELDFSPRLAARAAYLSIGEDEGFSLSARWYYRR